MLKIIVEITDFKTGDVVSIGHESKQDLINCINEYFKIFKILPPVGTSLSFQNDEPYIVDFIEFSNYEKCTFVYLKTFGID